MLTLSGITKAYAGRTLFRDVTLQINRKDRLGLVGPNGAGKTTLFSIILGTETSDEGTLILERNAVLGHLPQESAPVGNETVLEVATDTRPLPAAGGMSSSSSQPDSGHPSHPDIEADAHLVEARAKQVLTGLAFRQEDFKRPAREMSGGWVMRAHLARLLVRRPDLLMLDEPTNHLDLSALLWLQNHLQSYPGAILVISHDREFLNRTVTGIVELSQGRALRYHGNYDDFLIQREAAEAQQWAAYKNQQREIARLMEFVDRFRAKNTKATQAQSKLKQIERMEKIEAPTARERTLHFRFPQPTRSGLKTIRLQNVHHAYGRQVVYQGLEFEAERGQRIVLVGPNGAGKSTLLKLLAGVLPVQSGNRLLGHNVNPGYYSQNRVDVLDTGRTVLEEALDTPRRLTEEFARTVLGAFLFRGDDVFKKVGVLSGGEKSRLALVKLLLDPPNLLLMDEPTTHLDLASIDALIAALQQFQGTLIFISHDVHFIRSLAGHVVHVEAGKLAHYPGDYTYYLDKTSGPQERAASSNNSQSSPASDSPRGNIRERKRVEAEERQMRSRARKEQKLKVTTLENEIHELEQRQLELTEALENPETYADTALALRVNRELSGVVDQLQELTTQWEKEALRLSELESA